MYRKKKRMVKRYGVFCIFRSVALSAGLWRGSWERTRVELQITANASDAQMFYTSQTQKLGSLMLAAERVLEARTATGREWQIKVFCWHWAKL